MLAAPAGARPGDACEPIVVGGSPFVHASTGAGRRDALPPLRDDDAEPLHSVELAYLLVVPGPSLLRAELSTLPDCQGQVSLLDGEDPLLPASRPRSLASAPRRLARLVDAGLASLLVEVAPADRACELHLRLDVEPLATWYARPVAAGVQLRTWRGHDADGAPRFVAILDVDTAAPGVALRPLVADGCARTSTLGRRAGAVAALNGGFFGGPRCRSASLLQLDGVARAFNARDRSALGVAGDGSLQIQRVVAGRPWPAVRHALGGVPRLVRDGRVDVPWREERARPDFAEGRHPRSAVARTRGGALLVAVDGRSPAGTGMTLDELAHLVVEQGAVEALNLDGGGSTALWVAGEPGDGVVNHPSDGALVDTAAGRERPVGSALGVFAPARRGILSWHSAPLTTRVAAGTTWAYEALARSDLGAPVVLSLAADGDTRWAALQPRTDGSARLELRPDADAPTTLRLRLVARAPGHADAVQELVIDVGGKLDGPRGGATIRP